MDHEAIIQIQMIDQSIIEEAEYGNVFGIEDEYDPVKAPELFEQFIEEGYTYGEEEIPLGKKRGGLKGIKVS